MKDWPEEASPHLGDIRRWLKRGYRLGMCLDGLVALDFDPAPGLFGLEAEFGSLPFTWQQTTPRAGLHRIYRATSFRTQCRWRTYLEGAVDVKAGANAFVVLYGKGLPNLEGVAELPERVAAALPRQCILNEVAAPSATAWAALEKGTSHYRANEQTRGYLREDEARLAGSQEGEQNALLWRLGFKWGCRVRDRYVSLGEAFWRLCEGAGLMRAWREGEPWDEIYVQDRLRAAMLAGLRN